MKVINTLKPRSFDDVQLVADALRQHRPVILNFEATDPDEKKRFIDFISGSVQGVDGELYSVNDDVYLCVPTNVHISDDKHRSKK